MVTRRSAEQLLHEFRSSSEADVAMSLLRSRDAVFHLALLAAHLGEGQVLDGQSLASAIDGDIPSLLRSYGVSDRDTPEEERVPLAANLLTRWTKKGWVHRSVDLDTRIERYQLTSGAAQAVRQMQSLQRRSSVATESALAMVMAEMQQIATDANPDPAVRRTAIQEQVAALEAQLEALEQGDSPQVEPAMLVDRVAALVQLIERIPADVARYGEQMHTNTAALLRLTFTDDPENFAESLQRMFEGHDVIAESPEGQAFRAFATVIATPSQRGQLEGDIAEVIHRVNGLPRHLAESLSGFIDAMWRQIQEVEETRAVAFRRMSNFVRGGDVLHYRSMRTRVAEAQAAAADAYACTHGGRDIGFVVPMNTVEAQSVGRLRLDPGTSSRPDPVDDSTDEFTIDPSTLGRLESIDWGALTVAIDQAVEAHGGFATLPEVLAELDEPRTGDIIALWWLATRYGDVDEAASARVLAYTRRGRRVITLPYMVFADPVPDPIARAGRRQSPQLHAVAREGRR